MITNDLHYRYKNRYIEIKKQLNRIDYNINNVIIIGAGCAGLTAGLYCARANLKPLIFAGNFQDKGGLLTKTNIVENFPGYPEGILGYDLIKNMEDQAIKYGSSIIDQFVVNIKKKNNLFILTDDNNNKYYTKSIIVATGSKPNKLNLPNEEKLWGKGISSCAVCDGALYKNKIIVVVGGGDSALEAALFLTKFSKITILHRKDTFRASQIMQQRVFNNPNINIIYDSQIIQLNGHNKLDNIVYKNTKTNQETTMKVDGLFYGLGITPNSYIFKDLLELDSETYIKKYKSNDYETITSVTGIFVAGDVSDKKYKQAIVAAGDGCRAALDVISFLSLDKHPMDR